jgi:hypothetical protein
LGVNPLPGLGYNFLLFRLLSVVFCFFYFSYPPKKEKSRGDCG